MPFTVRAITHTGRAVSAACGLDAAEKLDERGDVVAVRRSCTSQPKAANLLAQIAPDRTRRRMQPSICSSLWSMMATRLPRLLMGGEHGRLPHLALLALAVAEHREDEAVLAGQAQAGRQARGHGKPLAERAGGHLHAGQQVASRDAPAGACPSLRSVVQLLGREVAGVGERRVERRRRMPLGQDEPVAAGPAAGSSGSWSMTPPKYSAVRMSVQESDPPGCPLPASVIMRHEYPCECSVAFACKAAVMP